MYILFARAECVRGEKQKFAHTFDGTGNEPRTPQDLLLGSRRDLMFGGMAPGRIPANSRRESSHDGGKFAMDGDEVRG